MCRWDYFLPELLPELCPKGLGGIVDPVAPSKLLVDRTHDTARPVDRGLGSPLELSGHVVRKHAAELTRGLVEHNGQHVQSFL